MAETPPGPARRPEPPGTAELFRTSLLVCGGSLLIVLLAFWIYRAYAWLFPG